MYLRLKHMFQTHWKSYDTKDLLFIISLTTSPYNTFLIAKQFWLELLCLSLLYCDLKNSTCTCKINWSLRSPLVLESEGGEGRFANSYIFFHQLNCFCLELLKSHLTMQSFSKWAQHDWPKKKICLLFYYNFGCDILLVEAATPQRSNSRLVVALQAFPRLYSD